MHTEYQVLWFIGGQSLKVGLPLFYKLQTIYYMAGKHKNTYKLIVLIMIIHWGKN